MDRFENISPLDYRYVKPEIQEFLSENSRINYQLKVEAAIAKVLGKRGFCSPAIAQEIVNACKKVTPREVYEEEKRIRHDIRALVNCIRKYLNNDAKPYVHLGATSYDIVCTAESLRFKDFVHQVLLPELKKLLKVLIRISQEEKDTLQIGRTHGQHAVPITFGFAMAEYVSRLGKRILKIEKRANNLRGKLSGAVGAYNSTSLFFQDPEKFEEEVLAELGLKPAKHSTQIVEPEYMLELIHSVVSAFGVLANLADDMRNLQRSEISEIAERFLGRQVGSSTMPHKRNPWHFENVKSLYKEFMPRIVTHYLDQISEHQRDLTNSASGRFISEILAGFAFAAMRLRKQMEHIVVYRENLKRNFNMNKDMIIAEPLYLLLAFHGHPDAHECVKKLVIKSKQTGKPIMSFFSTEPELRDYWEKFTPEQREVLENPEKYTGIAAQKAEKVCSYWKQLLQEPDQ